MQREKIDATPARLRSIVFRQHRPFQESADLGGQFAGGASFDQLAQPAHRLRVALVGRALDAQSIHQLMPTERPNQVVETRQIGITAARALRRVEIETIAVSSERIRRKQIEDLARFVAQRMLVAQREGHAELVEEVDESGFTRVLDARLAQRRENLRQRATVIECTVRSAGMDAVTLGEMLELPTRRMQRAPQRKRIVREEVRSARQLRRHPAKNREIESVAVVRDENVRAAEFT